MKKGIVDILLPVVLGGLALVMLGLWLTLGRSTTLEPRLPGKDGVPAGPINTLDEVMVDPQVVARGMQIELDGIPGVRAPFKFSDAELSLHRPAPKLGEDNAG